MFNSFSTTMPQGGYPFKITTSTITNDSRTTQPTNILIRYEALTPITTTTTTSTYLSTPPITIVVTTIDG
jgi:hypothetical protein